MKKVYLRMAMIVLISSLIYLGLVGVVAVNNTDLG